MGSDTAVDTGAQLATEIATAALGRYGLAAAALSLINISENTTFAVDICGECRFALRVHRPGYHSRQAIGSELAWLMALATSGAAVTPRPVFGRDGELVQAVAASGVERQVVLFHWEAGREPSTHDAAAFVSLGAQAARLHEQVGRWALPAGFTRHSWTFATTLGETPHWGRWLDGIGMTPELARLFADTVDVICHRLAQFGIGQHRFGLVHGDMRLANILIDGPVLKVIDFDDCGFSWLLYDCATTVSFFEHEQQVPELLAAWVRGYRSIRDLPDADAAEIPTFVMLRRLLLVAWLGSRPGTELARTLGAGFTKDTGPLCAAYLDRFTLPKP